MSTKKTEIDLDRLAQVVGGATIGGTGADDRLAGTSLADVMTGGGGSDQLNAGAGNDTLDGGDGNDMLDGGAGNDILAGGAGNDVLVGGDGNDILTGGAGGDTFVWNTKAGSDVIKDFDPTKDTIRIEGARGWDDILGRVNMSRFQPPDQATIMFGHCKLVIEGVRPTDLRPEWFGFMHEGHENLTGGSGADTLNGEGGHDVLNGGAGNDTLTGGSGNDTFVYDPATGGKHVVTDFRIGEDRINIIGVGNWADLQDRIVAVGNDTLIRFGENAILTLRNIDAGDLTAKHFGLWSNGTAGNDTLKGTNVDDVFDGGAGNDTLSGGAGFDVLSGGAGDDRIDGGTGNDALTGDAGSDTFVWNARNGGVDRITDFDPARDRIVIDGATSWQEILAHAGRGLNSSQTAITFGSNKLLIDNIKPDQLKPQWFGFMYEGNDVMTGGAGNDALNGASGNDTLNGGAGNDVLTGGVGSDTFVFNPQGGGSDRITDFKRGEDVIRIEGIAGWAELKALMRTSGNDTLITFPGGATLTIEGEKAFDLKPEHFGFAAQTSTSGADTWTGTRDNESFAGGAGADTLDGGGGNDILTGGAGGDLFVFDPRGNSGSDLITDFNPTEGDRISIPGMTWEQILKAATNHPVLNQVTLKFGDKWLTIQGLRREDLTPQMFDK